MGKQPQELEVGGTAGEKSKDGRGTRRATWEMLLATCFPNGNMTHMSCVGRGLLRGVIVLQNNPPKMVFT